MRNLLVVSQSHLPDDVIDLLEQKHWGITYAEDLETACRLDAEQHFLVGLVILNNASDPQIAAHLQQPVLSLPHIKWIAALAEELIEMLDIKRFITDRLYDFQVFPIESARLATVLGHAYGMAKIERELKHGDQQAAQDRQSGFSGRFGLVGNSPVMLTLYRMIQRAA